MAADIVWLDQAKDDILELINYLFPTPPAAALDYIDEPEHACSRLADYPLQGWQYNDRYRALVVRHHLIFYRYEYDENKVVVVAVIDGRRDLSRILQDR